MTDEENTQKLRLMEIIKAEKEHHSARTNELRDLLNEIASNNPRQVTMSKMSSHAKRLISMCALMQDEWGKALERLQQVSAE